LFNLAEYSALSKKEQKAYMESLKKYNDWQNVLEYAHEEGYQEAVLKYEGLLQEAIKQVKEEKKRAEEKEKLLNEEKKRAEEEKKRAEEKEKLLNEEHKKLLETAQFLKSLNVAIELIVEKTGLTREEIEKLP
jgi:hypothetical protein